MKEPLSKLVSLCKPLACLFYDSALLTFVYVLLKSLSRHNRSRLCVCTRARDVFEVLICIVFTRQEIQRRYFVSVLVKQADDMIFSMPFSDQTQNHRFTSSFEVCVCEQCSPISPSLPPSPSLPSSLYVSSSTTHTPTLCEAS